MHDRCINLFDKKWFLPKSLNSNESSCFKSVKEIEDKITRYYNPFVAVFLSEFLQVRFVYFFFRFQCHWFDPELILV